MSKEKTWNLFEVYDAIKDQHPDAIVLVQDGDFYEAYNDDAATLHGVCSIVVASRAIGDERRPMACVPDYSVDAYVRDMVNAGHRVAKVNYALEVDVT